MAFGTSSFLFAVGAVSTYGVTATVEGFNLDAIGVIRPRTQAGGDRET